MSDAILQSPLSGVTVSIPADHRILNLLLGHDLQDPEQINQTIAKLCPITYEILQKANDHIVQVLDETKEFSLKKIAAQALSVPLTALGTLFGLSYFNKRFEGAPHAVSAALIDGRELLKNATFGANAIVHRAFEYADKQFSQECIANFTVGYPVAQALQNQEITSLLATISGLFALAYAGNYWHWKSVGDFANEIKLKLPEISKELSDAKLEKEIPTIQAILKSHSHHLSKFSAAKKTESWPKAGAAASFTLASLAAYFSFQNAFPWV